MLSIIVVSVLISGLTRGEPLALFAHYAAAKRKFFGLYQPLTIVTDEAASYAKVFEEKNGI